MNTSITNIKTDFYFNISSVEEASINSNIRNVISDDNLRAIETIKSYKTLYANWDGYGAMAPVTSAILKATSFILSLSEYNVDVFFVAPTPDGDILVETKLNDANLEFELTSSSNDTICASQNGELKSEAELNDTTFVSYLRWLICPNGDCPPNL